MVSLNMAESASGATNSSRYCPCIVCFKNVSKRHQNLQEQEHNSKLLKLFINLLERLSLSPGTIPEEVELCNGCAVIVEPVTKLFHQIQCLQLQLDLNLDKVRKVMASADKASRCVKRIQAKDTSEDTPTRDIAVTQLRRTIKSKLKQHKARSFPRVVLYNSVATTSRSQGLSKDEFELETEEQNFGLGWIISFVMIVSLSFLPSEDVNPKTPESELGRSNETDDVAAASCSMEVDGAPEQTPQDVEAATVIRLKASSFAPPQSHPVESKQSITLPVVTAPLPRISSDISADVKLGTTEEKTINKTVLNYQEEDLKEKVETRRRSLRCRYNCTSCWMTFSTSFNLESHQTTCNSKVVRLGHRNQPRTEISSDNDNPVVELTKIKNEKQNPRLKTEINENGCSFSNACIPASAVIHETNSAEEIQTFQCLPCKKSFKLDGVRLELFMQHHNMHMHSNGQTFLDQSTIKLLQISGADVKLDSEKFTKQTCSFPECKTLVFADNDSFEYHKSLHGAFKCNVCEFECSFAVQLAIHEADHGPKTSESFSCPRCPFVSNADYKYYNHFLESHLNLKTEQAKCGICAKTFLDLTVPLQHFVNEHDVSRLENVANVYRCLVGNCEAYFLKSYQLGDHKRAHNKKQNNSSNTSHSPSATFKCGKCSIQFDNKSQLITHRLTFHKKEASFGAKQITPDGITINDVVYKLNARYSCSVKKCQEKFMTQLELETHSKLHGTFPCQFCPEVFDFAPDLSLHEKEHGFLQSFPTKKFNCSRCDYKSAFRNRYIHHHLETHLGLAPDQIKCPICNFSFIDCTESGLKTSLLRHWNAFHNPTALEHGQRFINCDLCSANFVTGLQLDCHKNQVHKLEFEFGNVTDGLVNMCPTCKKCFDSQEHLKNHQKAHF